MRSLRGTWLARPGAARARGKGGSEFGKGRSWQGPDARRVIAITCYCINTYEIVSARVQAAGEGTLANTHLAWQGWFWGGSAATHPAKPDQGSRRASHKNPTPERSRSGERLAGFPNCFS